MPMMARQLVGEESNRSTTRHHVGSIPTNATKINNYLARRGVEVNSNVTDYDIQVYAAAHTIRTAKGVSKYKDYVAYINNSAINDARDEEFDTYEKAFEIGLQVALERL